MVRHGGLRQPREGSAPLRQETIDESSVGGREVVIHEPGGLDPCHGLALARLDRPGFEVALVEMENDPAVGVLPAYGLDQLAHPERSRWILGPLKAHALLEAFLTLA